MTRPLPTSIARHGVERTAGRCGGRPCISGTRIWTSAIVGVFLDGASVFQIAVAYGLSADQAEAALRFECCLRARVPWAVKLAAAGLGRPK